MAIVNALAGIMVSDLTTAEAWQLLSRPADARPMDGLAETTRQPSPYTSCITTLDRFTRRCA